MNGEKNAGIVGECEQTLGAGDRPRLSAQASISGKENTPMIVVPAESFSRFAEALERIAEVEERRGPKEEAKEAPAQRLLSPAEVSQIMRLNVQTVTAWCRKGTLRASKIGGNEANGKGGKWLIPREEVDRYLHRQQVIHGKRKGGSK